MDGWMDGCMHIRTDGRAHTFSLKSVRALAVWAIIFIPTLSQRPDGDGNGDDGDDDGGDCGGANAAPSLPSPPRSRSDPLPVVLVVLLAWAWNALSQC
jgi:hypothetical protein